MNKYELIVIYAARLCRREWRRFVLPFLSLTITAVVLSITLLLTSASSILLSDQARELQGGDVVVESVVPIDPVLVDQAVGVTPQAVSQQLSFTATIESQAAATAVSVRVVDAAFPLYGSVTVADGVYRYPPAQEMLLDETSAAQLQVSVGDQVRFGSASYRVAGIITAEPTSLLSGFRFLPRVLMSAEGFERADIDPALLRPEYTYAVAVEELGAAGGSALRELAANSDGLYRVQLAGDERGGLQTGLGIVRDFLIVAILITAVLATVNIFASTVYFMRVEQQSFAIMRALGLSSQRLALVLGLALMYVVLAANAVGVVLAKGLFFFVRVLVERQFMITLPHPEYLMVLGFTTIFLIGIAIAAFAPTLQQIRTVRPKQLLAGAADVPTASRVSSLLRITAVTLIPLLIVSSWLLESVLRGAGIVLGVIVGYVLIASVFALLLGLLYRWRGRFSFAVRSVIAHKRADGLFGIVSFTSLFVALAAFASLVLIQESLREYLTTDLSRSVPTTYILDVQPSQQPALLERFPDLTLFSNTPARIVAIDALRVQEALAEGSETVDRELGREFNITARDMLLESDRIVSGTPWVGQPGELSVDEEFAARAGIALGSRVVFSVQGFLLEGVVTSLRQTDSRSGLPFFYFILSPTDLEPFPVVYFGYGYQSPAEQAELSRFLASTMPNVTIIDTQALAPLLLEITSLLFLVILVVAIPPLLIAVLLIITLIISSFGTRRIEAARLRAIGATTDQVLRHYLLETSALTVSAAVIAYGSGMGITYLVVRQVFELTDVVLFSFTLMVALGGVILIVYLLGVYLFKTDTMKLRELLSYGDH